MSTPVLALGRSTFGDPANKDRLMTRDEAYALLAEWVPNDRLRLHMKQVAAVMRAWALEREGADEPTALKWELAGCCMMPIGKNIPMRIAVSSSSTWNRCRSIRK